MFEAGSSGSSAEPSYLLFVCRVDGRQLDCDVFVGGEEQRVYFIPLQHSSAGLFDRFLLVLYVT